MKLRDLSYLVAIAQTLHFGKAAMMTHVSQPTLSVQLKKLEERLGVTLVERNNKNVRLTPAGKIIAEKAQRILQDIDAIKTYAKTLHDPYAGDLQLGIIPTLGPYLLPKMIQALHAKFPNLSLWLHEQKTHVLLEQLENGALDLAIMTLPVANDTMTTIPLFNEPFYFAVNHHHLLANKKNISLDDIKDENILLLEDGHCLREQALSVCPHVQTAYMSDFQATSLETLRYMVAQNLGSTLIPQLAATPSPNVRYIPFKNRTPQRELGLVFRKTHVRAELFAQMASLIAVLCV